ncbi:MAG: hypothetical protein ACE5GF_01030 [Thermodesulfobacteriota bacterium]
MNRRAVALLSGGLDSTLAVKVMLDQGIEVVALNFTSVFCNCTSQKRGCKSEAARVAEEFGVPYKVLFKGLDYIDVVRRPKFGYGQGINPCIDCRIYMFGRAREYMKEIGASFLFTGEVLGQRPMSQRRDTFRIIERESGLDGLILRPALAGHVRAGQDEQAGVVDRERLLGFVGRTRRPQMDLADAYELVDYPCPSGGCLLTDKIFSRKVRDLLDHEDRVSTRDLQLLKSGRHFRTADGVKIVVGRDEADNERLKKLRQTEDALVEPVNFTGPVAVVCGWTGNGTRNLVGRMLLRYAGRKASERGTVRLLTEEGKEIFTVDSPIDDNSLEEMRV